MHLEGCSPPNSAVASFNRWTSAVKASFKAVPLNHMQDKFHKQSIINAAQKREFLKMEHRKEN